MLTDTWSKQLNTGESKVRQCRSQTGTVITSTSLVGGIMWLKCVSSSWMRKVLIALAVNENLWDSNYYCIQHHHIPPKTDQDALRRDGTGQTDASKKAGQPMNSSVL